MNGEVDEIRSFLSNLGYERSEIKFVQKNEDLYPNLFLVDTDGIKLRLKNLKIRNLDEDTFLPLINLIRLDIEGGITKTIGKNTFSKFGNLDNLFLMKLPIKKVHSDAFCGLQKLRDFGLVFTELSEIDENLISQCETLEYLYLNNNKFTTLPSKLFEGLDKLVWIDLSGNSLVDLPPTFFRIKRN